MRGGCGGGGSCGWGRVGQRDDVEAVRGIRRQLILTSRRRLAVSVSTPSPVAVTEQVAMPDGLVGAEQMLAARREVDVLARERDAGFCDTSVSDAIRFTVWPFDAAFRAQVEAYECGIGTRSPSHHGWIGRPDWSTDDVSRR